jgi:hypothetical protein
MESSAWSIQVASDVLRDGLGVELLDASRAVRAEVFRCDADNTVAVYLGGQRPPTDVLEWFYGEAMVRLGTFEDGSPLPARSEWRSVEPGSI